MSTSLAQRIQKELDLRKNKGLFRMLDAKGANNGDLIDLAGYDYFELGKHQKIIQATKEAIDLYGTASAGSPLVVGYKDIHKELEDTICDWYSAPAAMIWNTGYIANQSLLKHLPSSGDLILADRIIHHSMLSGITQSKAGFMRYEHCNLDHLETLLEKTHSKYNQIFVTTETVFSMDGNSPDLPRLVNLKKKYPFFLIVDEAHALGWFGPEGNGLCAQEELLEHIDILVGTFGKALASQGAFTIFKNSIIKDYLVNTAGGFIYSTYLPPACAASALAAIEILRSSEFDRNAIQQNTTTFKSKLKECNIKTIDGCSPIVPILINCPDKVLRIQKELLENNILVGAIRPPTVPTNTSRLRISLKYNTDMKATVTPIIRCVNG